MGKKLLPIIAIVDDDEILQFTIKKMIYETGLVTKAISFLNGAYALDFINNNKNNPSVLPDIILLDIYMPSMNGFVFLEKFEEIKKEVNKDIAIYVSSSTITDDEIARILVMPNVTEFLSKPVPKEVLVKVIKENTPS